MDLRPASLTQPYGIRHFAVLDHCCAASHSDALRLSPTQDTFLDAEHVQESFPGTEIEFVNSSGQPAPVRPFRITFPPQKQVLTAQRRHPKGWLQQRCALLSCVLVEHLPARGNLHHTALHVVSTMGCRRTLGGGGNGRRMLRKLSRSRRSSWWSRTRPQTLGRTPRTCRRRTSSASPPCR
jgi:hypothetical protein